MSGPNLVVLTLTSLTFSKLRLYFLAGDVAQVFVDESGQYFYQNVDGSQRQMVVVSSEGGDAFEGEGGGDGSVILHTEEDSMHEVCILLAS